MLLHQISVRYITLWLARSIGFIRNWLFSGWRPPLLLLIAVGLSVFLAEWLAVHFHVFNTWSWSQVIGILAFYALCGILWWAWQARKRLVIEEFLDYTDEQPQSTQKKQRMADTKGLARLLLVQLAQLRDVYREVDERRAIPTQTGILTTKNSPVATIKTGDMSEFLKNAVSAESKLSLGPIAIPLGTLLGFFGRIVQGPRIIGSLHKEADSYILTAQKVGSGDSYSWRVDRQFSSKQAGGQETLSLEGMVRDLALQIFTDLQSEGSTYWKATAAFSEGLQIYRDCLRSSKHRKLNLQKAERKLIETRAEDNEFNLVHYNLGVIYTELQQPEAAKIAFLEAIKQSPQDWNGYFASALNHLTFGIEGDAKAVIEECKSAIRLCDRIIELTPGTANMARAYFCKADALYQLYTLSKNPEDLCKVLDSIDKAVVHSWKALCIAESKGQGRTGTENRTFLQLKTLASVCLNNLAAAYLNQAYDLTQRTDGSSKQATASALRKAEALLRQALFLNSSNADYHFLLGNVYLTNEQYRKAIDKFKSAIRIDPERPAYWAYRALAYAKLHDGDSATYACEKALDHAYLASQDENTLEILGQAYTLLNKPELGQQVAGMKGLLDELEEARKQGEQAIGCLKEKRRKAKRDNLVWEYAQIALTLGRIYLDSNNPKVAEKYFREAIHRFKEKHPGVIRDQGLHVYLAYSLLNQNKNKEALQEAEWALLQNPLGEGESRVYAQIFYNFEEYELAIEGWQKALLLDPNNADTYLGIGLAYLRLGENYRDLAQRKIKFQEAIKYFWQALELYTSDVENKSRLYFWLGLVHLWLDSYNEAILAFQVSQSLGLPELHSRFYLGYAYLRDRQYDWCIEQFKALLEEADKREKDTNPINEVVEGQDGGNMTLGELFALAYWGQAYAYVQRDSNLGNPDAQEVEPGTALDLIRQAKDCINEHKIDSTKFFFPGKYLDCEGWIFYKLGKTDDAIKLLEQSVIKKADAEVHLHLASAYERKLQNTKDEDEKQRLIFLVQAHCQHVQELDFNEIYKSQVTALQQSITSLEGQKLNTQAQQLPAATNNVDSSATAQVSQVIGNTR